jgi:hypothetical protein
MALIGSNEERKDSFESLLSSFDSIVCRLVALCNLVRLRG